MAIIVDFSQIFLSNLMKHANSKWADDIEPDLVRHMVLNSIRAYRTKYLKEFGELIIACDSKNYWRKDLFPQYKAHRKSERAKTNLDWDHIFGMLDDCISDLKTYFPYPVVKVDKTEADDIIATLAKHLSKDGKVMIISGDHDFQQLQQYPNIYQYNPVKKRDVVSKDPRRDLYEHIIRGDKGDGIPNILSADNTFTDKIRSAKIYDTYVQECLTDPGLYFGPEQVFEGEVLRNFQRNQALIDLDLIPENVAEQIISEYNEVSAKPNTRSRVMTFMVKHKMKHLIGHINDF